jgi:2'-5' RNA ligase
LGEIELSKISEISFILKNFKFNKFEIEFSGCGIFPNFSHPRVLWVGVKNGKEDLIKISGEINQELSKLKFEKEKNFHPHLTIGRIKSNRNKDKLLELIKEKNGENFGKMYVEEIVLMKSTLTQKGPIYEEIEKFKLEKE